jgi:phage terminase large subunit
LYLDGVVLDEYADMSPRIFSEVIRPALSDREGWAIFIGSAKGGSTFHELYERIKDDPGWNVKIYKASETGVIDPKELEDAKKIMTDDEFEQEYECSWTASIQGAYYAKQLTDADKQGRFISIPYEQNFPVHTFWDLGVGDATSIWFMQAINNELRFIDFYEASGEGLPHYADVLNKRGYVYGKHFAPHDIEVRELGSGVSRIQTALNLGIRFSVAPKLPIDDGINAARMIFNRCWFDKDKCHLGIQALRNYRKEYDEKRRQFKSQPFHDWSSHAADAFRYFAVSWKEEKKKSMHKQPRISIA